MDKLSTLTKVEWNSYSANVSHQRDTDNCLKILTSLIQKMEIKSNILAE